MKLHARKDDPSTSHDAMDKISEKQMLILQHLHNNINSGATCNELSEQMACPRDHISPNMPKLEEKQLVKRSGYKRDGQQIWLHKNYIGWFSPLAGDKVMEVKPRKPSRKELVEALETATKELLFITCTLNTKLRDSINCTALDDPDYFDYQIVGELQELLKREKGE